MMQNKRFTLIEMMVVMVIFIILFAIGTAAFNKASNAADVKKCKGELALLKNAIDQYQTRFGSFPYGSADKNTDFNFAEHLSEVAKGDSGWSGKRPMYIKYAEAGFDTDTSVDYDDHNPTTGTSLLDPWGVDYKYYYNKTSDSFVVLSAGADSVTLPATATWASGSMTNIPTGAMSCNDK